MNIRARRICYFLLLTPFGPRTTQAMELTKKQEVQTGICTQCLQPGKSIHERDWYQWTPLETACTNGHFQCVKLLLDAGAKPNDGYTHNNTPLHKACHTDNINLVTLLLKHNANPNARNYNEQTPLHTACKAGNAQYIPLLIDSGADPCAQDSEGQSPFALLKNKSSILPFLPSSVTDSLKAWTAKHENRCEEYPPRSIEYDVPTYGWQPLHWASSHNHIGCCLRLICEEANINEKNGYGGTPLHSACFWGSTPCAELLIYCGADINVKDNRGETPLHYACYEGKTDCVLLLVSKNADTTIKNNENKTPLEVAESRLNSCMSWLKKDYEKVIETLQQFEANKKKEMETYLANSPKK